MSDHDTIPPETDDEIRARLQAFAQEVTRSADTETALQRMPRRSRPPTIRLVAVAACLLAAVAVAAVVMADRQSVDTTDPSQSPTPTTDSPSPTQPRVITQGAQMKNRFGAPIASAAAAIMLLGACDDGPTTIAKGEDIELFGEDNSGLGSRTLNIDAKEEDGEVTGEFWISENVITIECADTDTDGIVILGGEATAGPDLLGERVALIVREGDRDSVYLHRNSDKGPCTELLASIPDDLLTNSGDFVAVEDGHDIATG